MDRNKKIILDAWKKAGDHNTREIRMLCSEFGVKPEPVGSDEDWTEYEFWNGHRFICSHSLECDEEELSDEEKKFAAKHLEICETSHDIFRGAMERAGFEFIDQDAFWTVWHKDGKEFSITNFAAKEEDIEVDNIKEL